MKIRSRKILTLIIVVAFGISFGVFAAITGFTKASSSQENNNAQSEQQLQNEGQNEKEVQEPSYDGSIKIDETKYEGLNESSETQVLSKLAKILPDEAKKAAENYVGGVASNVTLDNENGVLIYEVIVNGKEVKVDAGNGKVLSVETNDDKENSETNEVSKDENSSELNEIEDID